MNGHMPRVTSTGRIVHRKVIVHHPVDSSYQRFNKKVALGITKYVGSMTCFWVFCCLSLLSLPAVLSGFSVFHSTFPAVIIKVSVISLVAWVAQTFIQLVLLPALMVGQNLQNEASDTRAQKTFEDIELIVDRLKLDTAGGIRDLYEKLHAEIAALGSRRR